MHNSAYYEETQRIHVFFYLLLSIAFLGALFSSLLSAFMENETHLMNWIFPIVLAIVFFLIFNLATLYTSVRKEYIHVHLGCAFPMLWRRILLTEVRSVNVVEYRPILDAGGWGYRWGKYRGHLCWYYTIRGNKGVLVVTSNDKQHIIGSQNPEALANAIIVAMGAKSADALLT